MYGINLVTVAKVLGTVASSNALFSENGVVHSIHQEVIKYAAQQDIAMVKVMMRTLSQQNEKAYEDVLETLKKHFTEQELQDILP